MSSPLCSPVSILFSFICWIILLPTIGPVFLVLWIYKQIVYLVMKIFLPHLEMLVGADACLAEDVRKSTLYSIGVLFVLKNESKDPISIDHLRKDFAAKFLYTSAEIASQGGEEYYKKYGYRKLTKFYKSYGGHYFWVDADNFAVENHVKEYIITDEKGLGNFVTWWIKAPYKENSPMWEMALIKWNHEDESNANVTNFGVAFRIHHAMADGLSVLQMCDRMAGRDSSINQKPKSVSFVNKVFRYFLLPYLLKNLIGKIFAAPNPFAKVTVTSDSSIVFTSVQLDEVKQIKQAFNVPFATILMTIVGSIFRRLLQDSHIKELPEYVNLGNALPWPYRPPDTLCNEWTFGAFKIPIADDDVEAKLRHTASDFNDYLKEGSHLVIKPFIFGLMSLLPTGFMHRIISVTDTVTIAPSPIMSGSLLGNLDHSYRLWGCKVKHVYPIACNAEPHLALAAISASHGNRMDVSILVEKSIFPNIQDINQKLTQYFEAEFKKASLLSGISSKII